MSLIQKLIQDKELTSYVQIIVRDETGLYSPSNDTGYGGNNGNPTSKFEKYIFELIDLNTNVKLRQVQSDDLNNTAEYHNPSLARIFNKENITLSASNFSLDNFVDSLYKLSMNIVISDAYDADGTIGTDVLTNVANAAYIYANHKYIIAGTEIYNIQDISGTSLILSRNITATITSIKPLLTTYIYLIISDLLNDTINESIAKFSKNCSCSKDVKTINILSEVQLYYWGMQRSLDANDIFQAFEYFKMAKSLSCSIDCNCHG